MGDRVTVTLTVPTELVPLIQSKVDGWSGIENLTEDLGKTTAVFYDCGYGNLDFEKDLVKLGVAYTKSWEAGSDWGSGSEHIRFTEHGEVVDRVIYDDAMGISIDLLMPHIEDHEKLKELIQKKAEHLYVLPWDNQVEYGKRYQARQLITT